MPSVSPYYGYCTSCRIGGETGRMKRERRRKWFWLWAALPLALLLAVGGYYAWNAYHSWNLVYKERTETGVPQTNPVNPAPVRETLAKETYVFLMLGIDSGNVEQGRSDTNMLAVADSSSQKITLLSIPRDTRIRIQGHGKEKLAHAYAYGGADLAVKTVEAFFGIPVDYYVAFNFNGVKEFVDTLGGLSVDVEKNMDFDDRITHRHVYLKKGRQTLNGQQTLNYARYRGDADGDFGRMRRQQQVVRELLTQTVQYRNVAKINNLLKIMGGNVRMDIPARTVFQFASTFSALTGNDVVTLPLEATTAMIGGVSYMNITESERSRVAGELERLVRKQAEPTAAPLQSYGIYDLIEPGAGNRFGRP